jgi:hypothetical protein
MSRSRRFYFRYMTLADYVLIVKLVMRRMC